MGYYNQRPNQRKRRSWAIPLIVVFLVGIFLVAEVIPSFNANGTGDDSKTVRNNTADSIHGDKAQIINTSVNVDVSTQITEVVDEVTPAVVGVSNIQQQTNYWHQEEGYEAGTGSGVIYKIEDGTAFVVTNHHVIAGADTVEVVLYNEQAVPAELVGSDIFTDLAVLTMDASQVENAISIGSSDNVKVGEPAIAIGSPLGHMFSSTVTQGVISGTNRTIPQDFDQDGRADWQAEVIQTDAAINPGNSGGALINIYGQLIGINSMKINQESVEGIGFSIPIDYALPVIAELEATGEMSRPYLGLEIYSLEEVPKIEWTNTLQLPSEVTGGVYVWSVEPLSPADQVGFKKLDVITELDGVPVMNMIDLRKILYQEKKIGEEVGITYYRDGKRYETSLKLGAQ
ncbi:PDZ domain-containing protein [Oceanobacillus piezotolerans]|uniref:PDZ domain-containing protein n=1 Tax=Oceanobacillus piezotolerans TaxID=2448030 RepID=A0A498DJ29_9BACI|nr:trypsin-like peptidase domain-containing protein [Oceanobacillus piezotolerans]RLL41766.1 PDZ domain-containing protein [Oceanobacillus piezotolerans]